MVVEDWGAGVEGDRGTGLVVGEEDEGGGFGGCLEGFHGVDFWVGWVVVEGEVEVCGRSIVIKG